MTPQRFYKKPGYWASFWGWQTSVMLLWIIQGKRNSSFTATDSTTSRVAPHWYHKHKHTTKLHVRTSLDMDAWAPGNHTWHGHRHGRSSTGNHTCVHPQTRTLEHQATTRARVPRHGHSSTRQPQAPTHKLLFHLMEHSCYSSKNKNIKYGVRDTTAVRTFMSFSKNIQLKKKGKKRKSNPEVGLDTCTRATSLAKQTRCLKGWEPQSPSLGRTAESMRATENA